MKTSIVFLSIFISIVAHAQSEKELVMKPIHQLFDAMQKGDSALLHQTFTKEVTMATVGTKEGKLFFERESSIDGFLKVIGTPHAQAYNEMIWGEKIEVDGNFAQVWASYAFYLGNKFSHCGVDAFHLVKEKEGWKIFHLADTRQKEGCNVPTEISNHFK
jgi:hypothetical protein